MSAALVEAKRAFYREERVAAAYDQQRFGGSSGAYVNERELALVDELLPAGVNSVADVGGGTGRLLPLLRRRAPRVVGLDASMAMLAQAGAFCHAERRAKHLLHDRAGDPSLDAQGDKRAPDDGLQHDTGWPSLVQADAFALPLRSGSLDAATCLRLLFHFDDPAPVLREIRRAVRPGGTLVCDTSTWSPRGGIPLGKGTWGERVAAMSLRRFRATARSAGWLVIEERPCFLVSPYMYRRLPLALARQLEQLERHLPRPLLCRAFWRLEAAA